MYRIVRTRPAGCDLLTRSTRTVCGTKAPVFAENGDPRIITYGTKWGALKRMEQLRRQGYQVVVVDAATGMEIDESKI